ncbi:MAG TPA: ATP-dependent helicase HrpB [Aggregicoccus sp.]|nr:ATP-dependent helicase HrpB [Aggregicoccus sp.]
MSIDKVASVVGAGASSALGAGPERFSSLLQQGRAPGLPVAGEGGLPAAAPSAPPGAAGGAQRAEAQGCAAPGRAEAHAARPVERAQGPQAAQLVDRVSQAQRRLDHILQLAESGKSFSPVELLAFQAHAYRASQELDLAGKVVEKATGGVKQVLQTQL